MKNEESDNKLPRHKTIESFINPNSYRKLMFYVEFASTFMINFSQWTKNKHIHTHKSRNSYVATFNYDFNT